MAKRAFDTAQFGKALQPPDRGVAGLGAAGEVVEYLLAVVGTHGNLMISAAFRLAALLLGKQFGIFGAVWLSVRMGIAGKLRGATWLQIYAVSVLCGIGFTMSLFIGGLAFPGRPELVEEAKVGIHAGSFLSAIVGFLVLRFAPPRADHAEAEAWANAEIDRDGDCDMEEGSRA